MNFCCETVTSLGCWDSCRETYPTGLVADADGAWTVQVEYGGAVTVFTLALLIGDPIVFTNKFNENYTHLIKIFKPNGALFQNKCFSLQTYPIIY